METFALVIVILGLSALIGWLDWNNRKERSKLVNALMAKTPEQLRDLEFVDKFQPPKQENVPPDLISTEALTDDEFDKMIAKETSG